MFVLGAYLVSVSGMSRGHSDRIRVLLVHTHHRGGGGTEDQIRALANLSPENGLEVEVFARKSSELPANLIGRIEAGISSVYSPSSVRDFRKALYSFRPHVVHIYDLFPLISPLILPLCSERGIPVVMSCVHFRLSCPIATHFRNGAVCTECLGGHELRALWKNCRHNFPESVAVALHSKISAKLDLYKKHVTVFIAPSEFSRRWLIENTGVHPEKVTVITPFVDLPDSPSDPALGSYIAYAGRFVPEKGIDILAEGARLSGLPFRLSRNEYNLVAVRLPGDTRVEVSRDREELASFYRGARLLVMPSLWMETFGIVGAEAMSHGIPVVASRIGALSELVEDGVDGLLCEPGNPRDLADKVQRLWSDPALCRRMGLAARQKAISLWSADRHFERTRAVYERLCERSAVSLRRG